MGAGLAQELSLVNPARAGMILPAMRSMSEDLSKPRASGDDPELTSGITGFGE